jgi:hypothetical protein
MEDESIKKATQQGYENCLDSEKLREWAKSRTTEELQRYLRKIRRIQRLLALSGPVEMREILIEGGFFSDFLRQDKIENRFKNSEDFTNSMGMVLSNKIFPELSNINKVVYEKIESDTSNCWEKSHSWVIQNRFNSRGPSELEAWTYASRNGVDSVTSKDVKDVLYEWSTRIIRDGDDEEAERARLGELSVGEVVSIWKQRNVGPYYIWSPDETEEPVCDGVVQRLSAEYDIQEYDFWIDATAGEFESGPEYGFDQVRAAMWMFWTLLGDHELVEETDDSTLTAWGWAFDNSSPEDDFPWIVHRGLDEDANPVMIRSVLVAASFVYCGTSVPSLNIPSDRLDAAIRFLRKAQKKKGGWGGKLDGKFSVLSTTMAAWALHANGEDESRVRRALSRLEDAASPVGGWFEETVRRFPPIPLTVAIIELKNHFDLQREGVAPVPKDAKRRRFDVSFTFPGEARHIVGPLAEEMAERIGRENVFYDKFYQGELARPNLDTYLQKIYREESELVIPFFGREYQNKEWPNLEWRAIREIIKNKQDDRVMPMRLDGGDVDGLFEIDGYIDVNENSIGELADCIVRRLETM